MPRGTTLFRVIDARSLRALLRPPVLTASSRLRLRAQRRGEKLFQGEFPSVSCPLSTCQRLSSHSPDATIPLHGIYSYGRYYTIKCTLWQEQFEINVNL